MYRNTRVAISGAFVAPLDEDLTLNESCRKEAKSLRERRNARAGNSVSKYLDM